MKKNIWKSKTTWIAIFSLIVFVTKTYFGLEIPEADQLINLILLVGTTAGILNNPTEPK